MALFRFGRPISLRWNGLLIEGAAGTIFEVPDEYGDELQAAMRVEPTFEWLDSDEAATLRARVTALEAGGGGASLSSDLPLALGAAAAGSGLEASRDDHVHPTTGLSLTGHNHSGVYDPAGTASSAVSAHASASDPHPTYLTDAEGDAQYADIAHTHTGLVADYTSVVKQYVKNNGTQTIHKGDAVYISSANGTNPIVSLADADTEATSSKTLGLSESELSPNDFGYIITEGKLSGIDTSAATAGQSVWLSGTAGDRVYGAPPAEPAHSVFLGIVTKANASTGEIFIKVQNGYELDELHDVSAGSPTAGDLIQWATDGTTYMWRKKSLADAGISATSHNHTGTYDPSGTASSAVTTHAAVTTSVHGITNTANLVYTSDSRLSDSRTPISHTHAEADVTSLTTDLGLKAPLASPTFTGTVTLPSTTSIGTVSSTEIGYVDGVTSAIQTQINAKAATSHVHATSDVSTGNYVATLTAGTGVTLTNNSGNAASPTVAIGQAVETTSNVTFNQVTITAANSTYASRATVASSAQTFTTGTEATVALDTASGSTGYASYDPKSWFNNAGDYIAPTVAGFYIVTGCVVFVANATGYRELNLQVDYAANGTWVDITSQRVAPNASQQGRLNVSTVVYLQANARLRMRATQNSGGNLDTVVVSGAYPVLSVARVGA